MVATVLIALGSNRPHAVGSPGRVLDAAVTALVAAGLHITTRSRTYVTAPLGPGGRSYANAVVVAETAIALPALLVVLQGIERGFGRRHGRRWGARVLDLDIIGADAAVYPARLRWRSARGLVVPHRALATRRFVLDPLVEIAPDWRHPMLHSTARQLRAKLRRLKATSASP